MRAAVTAKADQRASSSSSSAHRQHRKAAVSAVGAFRFTALSNTAAASKNNAERTAAQLGWPSPGPRLSRAWREPTEAEAAVAVPAPVPPAVVVKRRRRQPPQRLPAVERRATSAGAQLAAYRRLSKDAAPSFTTPLLLYTPQRPESAIERVQLWNAGPPTRARRKQVLKSVEQQRQDDKKRRQEERGSLFDTSELEGPFESERTALTDWGTTTYLRLTTRCSGTSVMYAVLQKATMRGVEESGVVLLQRGVIDGSSLCFSNDGGSTTTLRFVPHGTADAPFVVMVDNAAHAAGVDGESTGQRVCRMLRGTGCLMLPLQMKTPTRGSPGGKCRQRSSSLSGVPGSPTRQGAKAEEAAAGARKLEMDLAPPSRRRGTGLLLQGFSAPETGGPELAAWQGTPASTSRLATAGQALDLPPPPQLAAPQRWKERRRSAGRGVHVS